jgi:hypothetical protein
MPEGSVTEVVPEGYGLGQVFVQTQSAGNGARDLRHLERVGEASAVVVSDRREENLCLVFETTEGLRVDYPVAIPLKSRSIRAFLDGDTPAFALVAESGARRKIFVFPPLEHFADCHTGGRATGLRVFCF